VTYLRSRDARKAESQVADVYERAYDAERPELFFKAPGWRVAGHGQPVRVRRDSRWNVPEPELTLLLNSRMEIVGYCAGNDVSSRDIEGENPLYLPQAKVYDGACALGPGLYLLEGALPDLPIRLAVKRDGATIFAGETSTANMKRSPEELAAWLGRELSFPHGALLMTGTGIVPGDDFSLQPGDHVRVSVGDLTLENPVE
jgi:2-dehydro-3-deoxy-D-arabinonate dehydratase